MSSLFNIVIEESSFPYNKIHPIYADPFHAVIMMYFDKPGEAQIFLQHLRLAAGSFTFSGYQYTADFKHCETSLKPMAGPSSNPEFFGINCSMKYLFLLVGEAIEKKEE